jgi:hypothetical protein
MIAPEAAPETALCRAEKVVTCVPPAWLEDELEATELDELDATEELDLLDEELEATELDELDLLEDELEATELDELDLLEEELDATELELEDDPPDTSPVTSILSMSIPLVVVAEAVILNLTAPAGRVKLFEADVQLEFELNDFVVDDPPLTVISYDAVTEEV